MNRVRRGKDFKVLWSFFDYNGEPYQLDKTFLTLYVSNSFDRFEVTDFSVEENTITWIFRGKDQKALGDYTLELIQNNGTEGMIPIDSVDAFTLVQYSRDESLCGGGNVKIEDVTVNSTLDIETISSLIDAQLSEISVNPVQNKVITAALNNKADKSSVPTKTSQLTNDSGFITAKEVPAPDWNASTYKEGHIKNRTHHMQDYMCHYFNGSPIKISKPSDVGYVLLTYDTDLPEKFIRIEIKANESKTEEFLDSMGMPLIFTWDAGNSTINVQSFGGAIETYGMRAYYSSSAKGYDEYFVALDEGFIPEKVARKSELKTINGQSILGEGDIEIKGGSSTFVTDFAVNDLYELVYRGAHPVQANIVALQRALENKERIVVPYGTEDLKGYSLLQGYYEDLVYFTVADENGSTYVVEVGQYAGEIDRDNITHVSPKDNKINIADLQNGKVNKTDVATINGKSIINGGNITIEGGEGSLDSEVVSSTEASEEFPQVLYVEQTLTEAQKSQARKNIGADNTELKEQITELSAEMANIGNTTIVPNIENGKYIVATGYVGSTSDSCVTDYVFVGNTDEVIIYGAYLTDSRCIVGYNEKKEVVTAWETHTNGTPLIIPEDVEYIRITGKTGVAPYVKITDASVTNKIINGVKEVVVAESPSINKEEFSSGYLASDGKTIYSSSGYRTSHYIPVVGGANLVAEYVTLTSQGAIWWYDERENLLSVEPGSDVVTKLKLTFNVPISARYCRYVVETRFLDRSKLSYAENTFKYNAEIDKVNAIMSKSYDAPLNLFSAATSRPIITIIDDDTIIADYVTRFYNALSAVGVTGSYAVLTNQIETHPELAELLLSYDRKGFNACLHSYTQHVAFETATRDLSVAREDLVRGIQEMQKLGFTDYRHWVTPYGVNDAEMQDLAVKVGLDCLVSIGQSKVVGTAPTDSRYNIPRYSWNAAGEITAIKSLIDQCSANNGWLLLGTHVYNWAEGAFESAIAEVVAYAKSKGCVFMTLGEALRHRMPIYNFYETM